jgi:hypothetical protein
VKPWIVVVGLAFCATVTCAALGAEGPNAAKGATDASCTACLAVCEVPLSYDDSVLDESTDSYLAAPAREIATTAAIDMAAKLKRAHGECRAGYFARLYEAQAADVESLASRQPQDHATSAEIRALKRARTALYADAVVLLQASAVDAQSSMFTAAYESRRAVLDGVITSMSAPQQMRAVERLAVCEVLSAYKAQAPTSGP